MLCVALILLNVLFSPPCLAQTCDQQLCVAGCQNFDAAYNQCNFDYQAWDNKLSCLCKYGGSIQPRENALLDCTGCNKDGLGGNPLQVYQWYTVLCGTYEYQGEAAAVSMYDYTPTSTLVQMFSTTWLPIAESSAGCPPPPAPSTCKKACNAYLTQKQKLAKSHGANVNNYGKPLKGSAAVINSLCAEFGNMRTCDTCSESGEGIGQDGSSAATLLHAWEYTCGTLEQDGEKQAYKCWLGLPSLSDCYVPSK